MNYFENPALSQSKLKELKKSPRHFYEKHIAKTIVEEETESMEFGTAAHCCVFENEKFLSEYVSIPKIDKRTKEGKEQYAKLTADPTKKFLDEKSYNDVLKIKTSLESKNAARFLMSLKGHAEVEIYFKHPLFGEEIEAKAKLDFYILPCKEFPNGCILDLKTTQSARIDDFEKSVYNYGYYNQVAWYCQAVKSFYGTEGYPEFIFIPIEKEAPFECSFLAADPEMIVLGMKENLKLLSTYSECMRTGQWPGYQDRLNIISVPAWAKNKMEVIENVAA